VGSPQQIGQVEGEVSKPQKTVLYIYETVLQSWSRDFGTFSCIASLIGIGVILESDAMQWFGAIVGGVWIIVRSASNKHFHRATPQEAANILKRDFGVTAE
jgi:hypothetical protein